MSALLKTKPEAIIANVSYETLLNAMSNAAMSSAHALRLEMAVGVVIYVNHGHTSRDAKREVLKLYADAGCDCSTSTSEGYKTANRRLNTSADLYDWLVAEDKLEDWLDHGQEMLVINSITEKMKEAGLNKREDVAAYVGKPVSIRSAQPAANEPIKPAASAAKPPVQAPQGSIVQEPSNERLDDENGNVVTFQRRASDKSDDERYEEWLAVKGNTPLVNMNMQRAGFKHLSVPHLQVIVEPEATREDIQALVMQLLQIASKMDGKSASEIAPEVMEDLPGDDIGNRIAAEAASKLEGKNGNIVKPEELQPKEVNGNVPPPQKAKRVRHSTK